MVATESFLTEWYDKERGEIGSRDITHPVLVEFLRTDDGLASLTDLMEYVSDAEVTQILTLIDNGTRYPASDTPYMAELGRIVVKALKNACALHMNYQLEDQPDELRRYGTI